MSLESNVEMGEFAVIAVAVAVGGWLLYSAFNKLNVNKEVAGQGGSGALGNVANNTLEMGQSSQSYTSAFGECVVHPIDCAGSILGISPSAPNPDGTSPAVPPAMAPIDMNLSYP